MNLETSARLKERFQHYAQSFAESGKLHPMLQLKYDHCGRVSCEARDLAQELGWKKGQVELAEISGLFHDVGRFTQFQEFQTYNDKDSINHACRGFQVLDGLDWLNDCSKEEKQQILESVRLHNCRVLPPGLPPDIKQLTDLIRDADKLDIFFVLSNAIEQGTLKKHPGIIWDLPTDAPPSPEILEDVELRRMSSYDSVRSMADFNLLQLTWIFDINYSPTLNKIAQRKVVERISNVLPPGEAIQKFVHRVSDYLQERGAK